MEVVIQGTISALGYLEDGVYQQEPDCYESIRDLIRFLRHDNNTLLARRVCGERNIVDNDLIPIMKQNAKNAKMFDIVLRLMVNLVQPAVVSLMGKEPENRDQWQSYWELEENLMKTKLGFADVGFFKILRDKLARYFLETEQDDRSEEDRLVMERIIVLIRYIFAIRPTQNDERRTAFDSNSHDRVIAAFIDSGVHEVLISVASQSKERDFHLSILEIIAYVIREHKPCDIVSAAQGRSEEEKEKAEGELRMAFENEMNRQAVIKRNVLSNRHSRFAGSYFVKGMKAVNKENNLVVHKPVKDLSKLTFLDERKTKKRIASNRRPFEAAQKTHVSSIEIRLKLKTFVESVLSKAFNRLMKNTKEAAFGARRSVGQRNADMHYFLVMKFFMEYCRLARMTSACVNSCVGVEVFHHCQIQMDEALESANAQRKEGKKHGMRAQYALSAYKELVLFHQYLMDRGTAEEKEMAQRAASHILSVEEYRELGCTVIRRFNPGAMSKTFLRELVLATHYYFRMLEKSVKSGELTTVQKRQKKRRMKQRKNDKSRSGADVPSAAAVDSLSGDNLDDTWADISEELSDVIMGHIPEVEDQIVISALLDVTDEEHQQFAMLSVQRALRENRVADAVGFYRAARQVWLTEGVFGQEGMPAEEEFVEMREIFFVDLSDVSSALVTAETASSERYRGGEMLDGEGNGEYSEDEEDDAQYETKEVSFDFTEYVVKYCRTDVLKWYVFLLTDFASNSVELNKALVKMLHRVTFDLNMPSRLYQLCLFRIFTQVNDRFSTLSKEERKKSPLFELYTFGFHLLKRFMAHFVELGDKLAPEILFWKGPKECYEIENGYGSYEKNRETETTKKLTWTEELEDELRALYNEYRDMDERPESVDVLDFIEHNLSRPRTRKQIQKKMKEFGLDTMGAKANKGSMHDRSFPILDLKRLVEEFNAKKGNENEDLVNYIRESLIASEKGEFTRQKLIKQLVYLGIPYEKKRKTKSVSRSKWSEEAEAELSKIKQDYDDMDPEDHELINIIDYAMRLLTEKKPRRQVEQHLRDLGADVPETVKRPAKKSKPKEKSFVANSDSEPEQGETSGESEGEASADEGNSENEGTEKRGKKMPSTAADEPAGNLVDSDGEEGDMGERVTPTQKLALKRKAVMDSDEDDDEVALPSASKSRVNSVDNERTVGLPTTSQSPLGEHAPAAQDTKETSEEPSLGSQPKAHKKRKRIVDSDDEEEAFSAEKEGSAAPEVRPAPSADASPVRSTKKSKIILSDDEED